MDEQLRQLREGLSEIGCSREEIAGAERLYQTGRFDELKKHLRKCRCQLMDQMHEWGKRVDRMDYLIRQAEQMAE